jgi:hypothetical protein
MAQNVVLIPKEALVKLLFADDAGGGRPSIVRRRILPNESPGPWRTAGNDEMESWLGEYALALVWKGQRCDASRLRLARVYNEHVAFANGRPRLSPYSLDEFPMMAAEAMGTVLEWDDAEPKPLYDFDGSLPGTKQEQAWAQVGYAAYVKFVEEGLSWKLLHRDYKEAWIQAIIAIEASKQPQGPS